MHHKVSKGSQAHGLKGLVAQMSEQAWSVLFAVSVGVLMLAILLMRVEPAPGWVLLVYPMVGALLGLAASRTSPTAEQMAWIESGTIAAAAVVVLAGLVNMLLLDMLLRELETGAMLGSGAGERVAFFTMPAAAVLLWWGLQRRLSRLRISTAVRHRSLQAGIPAE